MIVPTITTERLLLRGFEPRDAEPYMTMMTNPEVTRYLGDGRRDIISVIRPANEGSIRVATSLGATPDGTVEFFGAPASIYRYPRTPA